MTENKDNFLHKVKKTDAGTKKTDMKIKKKPRYFNITFRCVF